MARGLRELVGRVMLEPEFLADLARAPEPVLAEYELTADEVAMVRRALQRLAQTPAAQRHHQFRDALLRRVAT